MTGWLRVVLIVASLAVMALVLMKIRKAQMRIADSTFWFLFAAIMVVFAVFPQVPFFFSFLIGIDSPSNFVFLFVIGALFVHEFYLTVELSRLRAKTSSLVQHVALREDEETRAARRPVEGERTDEACQGMSGFGDGGDVVAAEAQVREEGAL